MEAPQGDALTIHIGAAEESSEALLNIGRAMSFEPLPRIGIPGCREVEEALWDASREAEMLVHSVLLSAAYASAAVREAITQVSESDRLGPR